MLGWFGAHAVESSSFLFALCTSRDLGLEWEGRLLPESPKFSQLEAPHCVIFVSQLSMVFLISKEGPHFTHFYTSQVEHIIVTVKKKIVTVSWMHKSV